MRIVRVVWAAVAVLTVATACGPVIIRQMSRSSEVVARIMPPGFAVQAAPKSLADVASYKYELINVSTSSVAATHQTTAATIKFATVPNGTYKLRAEAFGSDSASITSGGPALSLNTVTVASPNVTYSTLSALTVTLQLLHGTGETIANSISVVDGNPWTGAPVGAP